MLRHLQRILFVLFAMQAWTRTRGQDFPKMSDIFDEFYKTEVQLSDQNQDGSSLATEYYDMSQGRGRLDVMVYGNKKSFFHYNFTGDILEVNSTSCIVWPEEESEYFYAEIFFGWLHKNPLIIGPSALLWFAQDAPPDYVDQQDVRGIKCDHYQLTTNGKKEKVTYDYYFAVKEWTTPYQLSGKRVPIRITVNGESSRDSSGMGPVNQVVDFSYFKPTIEDASIQPEIGLGCYGRVSDREMPKIPREFRFTAEILDLLKEKRSIDIDAIFERVWFSNSSQLGRLDIYKSDSMSSNLYDFKNGVVYSIQNDEICSIKPLRNSIFDDNSDDLLGRIKTPEQVLGLSGDFYYMGYRPLRGVNCKVFESAKRHTYFMDDEYYLLVTTVYFTEDYTEAVVEGEDQINSPVFIMISGYDEPSHLSLRIQYSIFGFDDVVGPTIFNGFPIQDCFPLSYQKSYFLLQSPVSMEIAGKLEMSNMVVVDQVKSAIMRATNISAVRLPYMKVDYESTGVYVTGLILDRPPFLSQFWREFYGPSRADGLKEIDGSVTKENCAFACVDEASFLCRGFHFCNGRCYLNKKSISDEKINADTKELGVCELYLRAEMNSTTRDPYLSVALKALENTVLQVSIPLPNNDEIEIKFPDVLIGEGLIEKNVTDKSYNVVYYGFQLLSADTVRTTIEKPDISTENDCYRACKMDTTIDCQSFSYCPDAQNGQCRISSVLISTGVGSSLEDLDNNKFCNLYSLLNVDYFTPYVGKVLMVPGENSFTKLTLEECAQKCRMQKDGYKCRGFEYCKKETTCVLHSTHVYDVKPSDISITGDKCTHYAAKFSADYLDMGIDIIDDSSNQRSDITLEECARACSEEVASCKSFNYCPPSNEYERDSSCSLTSLRLRNRSTKTIQKGKCHVYEKRKGVETYGPRRRNASSGYSQSGFAGIVIGMLVFGLLVGIGAFFGYSYYRSRRYNDGMSVRFMKQTNG